MPEAICWIFFPPVANLNPISVLQLRVLTDSFEACLILRLMYLKPSQIDSTVYSLKRKKEKQIKQILSLPHFLSSYIDMVPLLTIARWVYKHVQDNPFTLLLINDLITCINIMILCVNIIVVHMKPVSIPQKCVKLHFWCPFEKTRVGET